MRQGMMRLDAALFKTLYYIAVDVDVIGRFMVLITKLSAKIFYVIYAGFIFFLLFSRDGQLVPFLVGPSGGLLFTGALRKMWWRPRPFVTLSVQSLIAHDCDGSFPSKHAMSAFVIGMSVWYIRPALGLVVLTMAGITGLSRIMVGVHYPLDIVVGAMLGILFSVVSFTLFLG